MKKLILLFIVFLMSDNIIAQSCLPEGITFTTQAQVDSFQIIYPNCSEIVGEVWIGGEDITNLDSLNVLTSIEGDLSIGYWYLQNPALTSLAGLQNLTNLGGSLNIDRNLLLINLSGLEGLTTIGGELMIGTCWSKNTDNYIGNPALKELTGLDNLTSIGESLTIEANGVLKSLSSLGNLTSLAGSICIFLNDSLIELSGLDNIDPGSIESLTISDNFSLSTCDVQSICDYLVSSNGEVNIQNNAIGCNSQEEVEEACTAGLYEYNHSENYLIIYPNPTSTQITIELPEKPSNNTSLIIYNLNSQQLITEPITEPQTEIDISHLPAGIYIVKVWNDKDVMVQKVIKQ